MSPKEKEKRKVGRKLGKNGKYNSGRPTKLTRDFLKRAKEVIEYDINAIILTDEELVDEINEGLVDEAKIDKRTFERWKSKNKDDNNEELDENGKEFCRLIKKSLREQKKQLFNKFREEPIQWQRWAWIIERKFDEWNIRTKSEIETPGITKEIEETRKQLKEIFK